MADEFLPPGPGIFTPAPEQSFSEPAVPPVMATRGGDYGMDYGASTYHNAPRMGVFEAALKNETAPGALMSQQDAGITVDDDGTDPFKDNEAFPQYASRPELFTDVFNKKALAARRAQIDQEDEIRAVQERNPWGYFGAALLVQPLDPVNYLPVMSAVKIGKGVYTLGKIGRGVQVGGLGAAAAIGTSAAAGTAVQEGIIQGAQQTRTWEESAIAIGGSFLLAGALGGAVAGLSKAQSAKALGTIDAQLAVHGAGAGAPVAAPAMSDLLARVNSGERYTTQEIHAVSKAAQYEARIGRDINDPEYAARLSEIDRLATILQRNASTAQASELEAVVRNSFGSDGARLLDEGGVKIVQSVDDLPARPDGTAHFNDTRGMFDGKTAYLVADNVAPGEARGVLLHEVGVHYGMENMLGRQQFQQLLDDVMNRQDAAFAAAREAVPKETPAQHIPEEALAYLVENAPEAGIVRQTIAAVKAWLYRTFGNRFMSLSENDIRALAVSSLRRWNKRAGPVDMADPRYSRRSQTDTPEFRRWFGKSKVVDAEGNPKVFYHGSQGDITAFDPKRAKGLSIGLHFTSNPKEAAAYADAPNRGQNVAVDFNPASRWVVPITPGANISPVYLKVENPLVLKTRQAAASMEIDDRAAEITRLLDEAKATGKPYDGVVITDVNGEQNVVVFNPTQIKSATGNSGAFDPTKNDIRYSRAQTKAVADKAPAPIADALNTGRASVIADQAIFYSRGGEKRERGYIIAYHGSPHDFDRFSMDKIGTGEGAQAYGHGLYFAENEGVAKGYRDTLTSDRTVPAKRLLAKHGGDVDAALAAARAEIARLQGLNLTPETGLDRARSMIETQENNIAMLNALKNNGQMSAGRMYEVRINADPEHFLDWDKPLSEQPKAEIAVGKYLERALDQPGPIMNDVFDKFERGQMTGADVAKMVGTDTSPLVEAGIPGIKYLDAGSRGAGDGTRNYVVFDDSLIEIIRKYSRGVSRTQRIASDLESLSRALANIDNPDAFQSVVAARLASAGAEAVDMPNREELRTYGKLATKVQDLTWWMNPILRARTSPVAETAMIAQQGWNDVIMSNLHQQGKTLGPQVETLIRQQVAGMLGTAKRDYEAIYLEGRKAGLRQTRAQFSEAISAAMRRGDQGENQFVTKAAQMWRSKVFDPLKKMAQETRINGGGYLLDPDIETKFAESYLHRMANHERLRADEPGFKRTVASWMEGAMRNEYTRHAEETRARLAAYDQDLADLQLDPETRLAEMARLEQGYEDLNVRYAREADIRREYNGLASKAAELRRKGDKGGAKAALEEARALAKSGGDRYREYLKEYQTLNRRTKNVDLGYAGMAERKDAIEQRLEDLNDSNVRALDRLVKRGQKLERELARLDPQLRAEKIAELREQIASVLERTDKAAERLYKQVEAADKATARAQLQAIKERRAGGMREALAGNTEAKAAAAEAEREAKLNEQIRKYVNAERKRSEELSALNRRLDHLDALDLDGQAAELRAAIDGIVKQQSNLSIGRGEKSQRLKERLARVDQSVVDQRIKEIEASKKAIERQFYDRWETRLGGTDVDVATPSAARFSDWAKEYADQVFNHYTGRGEDAGMIPDFAMALKKGPLQERKLPVPDSVLEPWLENDIVAIAERYVRSMVGQVEVTRRFGRADMKDQMDMIKRAYLRLREQVFAAETPKDVMALVDRSPRLRDAVETWRRGEPSAKVTKENLVAWLEKREASDLQDVEAMRDLLLGRYKAEENLSDFGRLSRILVAYNFVNKMGGYIIGSLTDLYRPAMVHGLRRYMADGIGPLMKALSGNTAGFKAAREELAQAGIAMEKWLHGYTTINGGILDPYAPGTPIERLMDKMSKAAGKYAGITFFNDFTRSFGGIISMGHILDAAVGKKDAPYLAVLGVDPGMAARIAEQYKVHGQVIDGIKVPGVAKWSDTEAARVFLSAVNNDVNTIFVEKSMGDVPLLANRPVGRMLFQFRTFNMAANQRILMRGLQEDHAKFLGAMVAMTSIGMAVAWARSWRGGEERYEKFKNSASNPGFLIGEGLDNSGIFSLFFEAANTAEKLSQASGVSFNPIKKPLMMAFPGESQQGESTRFVRRSPLEAVLGPSAGIPSAVGRAAEGLGNIVTGQGEGRDIKAVGNILPFATHSPGRELIQGLSGDFGYGFD